MKAFVSVAPGLLDSNLVHALVANGHEAAALDGDREEAKRMLGSSSVRPKFGDLQGAVGIGNALKDVNAPYGRVFRPYYVLGGPSEVRGPGVAVCSTGHSCSGMSGPCSKASATQAAVAAIPQINALPFL